MGKIPVHFEIEAPDKDGPWSWCSLDIVNDATGARKSVITEYGIIPGWEWEALTHALARGLKEVSLSYE